MGSVWYRYMPLMIQVRSCTNVTTAMKESLTVLVQQADQQNRFSQPMLWIGIYIALASLVCALLLLADLLSGLLSKKKWFPCRYFRLNAFSLTVIAVAIKLPTDLNNPMPGHADQVAKLGSMAFMCIIMANLLPSLATMDTNELLANVTALGVLVFTLVVNVCIQINTGVIFYQKPRDSLPLFNFRPNVKANFHILAAIFYVAMLLILLMMYICSALAILKLKHTLESKYQACHHETSLRNQELQQSGRLITIQKLKDLVCNHWIMTTIGNPQFMASNSITTTASGVICMISISIYSSVVLGNGRFLMKYHSDYDWSIPMIFMIQYVGTFMGTMVPIYRSCRLSYSWSMEGILNHIKVFYKVESEWTDNLSELKKTRAPFPFRIRMRNHRCKIVIEKLKIQILSFCIGFQKVVVVACNIIGLILIFIIACFHFIWNGALGSRDRLPEQNTDLRQYDASLQDHMEVSDVTFSFLTHNLTNLIRKAEKRQPNNLIELLDKYGGFERVGNVNIRHFPSLLGEETLDSWSLTLVTLTAIAISLPQVQQNVVDSLLRSVSEGLEYATSVEESLNTSDDYVTTQIAVERLWLEVEVYKKWLGNKLQNLGPQVVTTRQILQWFKDRAQSMDNEHIVAASMCRMTETIMISNIVNVDEVSPEELFTRLSSTISDILVACLTNLPQVIVIKCQESLIDKREASVHAAAKLLGETMQIIQRLQDRELPVPALDGIVVV